MLIIAQFDPIKIGIGNQFGEGGFSVKTNRAGSAIRIGDNDRYLNGVSLFGCSVLDSGSQILSQISADSCRLAAGLSWADEDPALRGGVLKGFGLAKNIQVDQGLVIVGNGEFAMSKIEPQTNYHPKKS